MVLVIDNYDSFTYNLVHLIGALGHPVSVVRNDALEADEIRALHPSHLVISPGPGRPEQAGCTLAYLQACATELPILGVCLGHQAIGHFFGARIVGANTLVHGKSTPVFHQSRSLFANLPNPLRAGRYHSLIVSPDDLSPELEILATSSEGEIMALRHRELPLAGVQFPPESILTENGAELMQNFFNHFRS